MSWNIKFEKKKLYIICTVNYILPGGTHFDHLSFKLNILARFQISQFLNIQIYQFDTLKKTKAWVKSHIKDNLDCPIFKRRIASCID